jgi:hypothetical protein
MPKDEAAARKKTATQYSERGGYCTRTVSLGLAEVEKKNNLRANKVRNILFPLHKNFK